MFEVINQVKQYKISQLRKHPNNPRILKDSAYQTLKNSIENNPELLEARPVILSDRTGKLTIIGGNQRFQVVKDLGWLTIPGVLFPDISEEKEKEIMIRDNVSNGDWDWEKLQQDWDAVELNKWGLEISNFDNLEENSNNIKKENQYTSKINPPIYTPKGLQPKIKELFDLEKTNLLIKEINSFENIKNEIKDFLCLAATRHTVFNYDLIAEFYCHADKDVQNLMEKSALIIIDFNKAIESGFVNITEEIAEVFTSDYE